ncbi:2-dehydropantoate 2-reductase [Meredithblackwellia eburnea MCA 4105]
MSEILLFGLGAVGATHAFIFQHAGSKVTVCARSNFDVVKEKGLDFRSEKYGNIPNLKFDRVVKTPGDASIKDVKYDFIVCTNKAIYMNPSASEQIAPAVSENTTIVIVQNGVGNGDQFRERFPNNVVISAVTWVNANQPETGVIVHKGQEKMQIGVEWSDKLDRALQQKKLDDFVGILDAGKSEYELVPDIQVWRWKKTIWNCCWNTLTAATLCNTKQYLESSESAEITARALIDEMALIARTLGLTIEDEYLDSLISRADLRNGGITSSMMMDAKAQRPMEVEVILGAPLRVAKKLGLKTPVLETCTAIISAMDWRFQNQK